MTKTLGPSPLFSLHNIPQLILDIITHNPVLRTMVELSLTFKKWTANNETGENTPRPREITHHCLQLMQNCRLQIHLILNSTHLHYKARRVTITTHSTKTKYSDRTSTNLLTRLYAWVAREYNFFHCPFTEELKYVTIMIMKKFWTPWRHSKQNSSKEGLCYIITVNCNFSFIFEYHHTWPIISNI